MPRTSSFGGRFVVALALGLATCSSDEKPAYRTPAPTVPPPGSQVGVTWVGPMGITESVADIMARQANAPPDQPTEKVEHEIERDDLPQAPGSLAVSQWPPPGTPGGRRRGGPRNPQTASLTFQGATFADGSLWPPDTDGAAGPTQFFVFVNNRLRTFDKTTGTADSVLNVTPNTFFSSVRGPCGCSDPGITYDRLSQRWILTMINVGSSASGCDGSTPNRVLIAVSSSSTITSGTTFTLFQFQHDLVGTTPNSDTGHFADYPRHGVDANALYIGVNIFTTTSFIGTTGFVIRKSSILGAGPIVVTPFRQLGTGTTAGPYTPIGVGNDDANATEGYFIGVDTVMKGLLQIRRVSNPGGTPSISANISLTVPNTAAPGNPVALGSSKGLDGLDDRLGSAQLKNGSLWTVHSNLVTSAGVSSTSGTRDGVRWYEITNLTGTPTLRESGTLFDPASTNVKNFWMGSIAASGQGHVALGASFAGPSDHPGVALAGRLSGDTLGTTETATLQAGNNVNYAQNSGPPPPSLYRWGDYSTTTVDPNDNMTMWTIQEIVASTDTWGVKINKLLAPPPATPSSANPATVSLGDTVDVVVTGTSSAGSGFYDPGSAFPNRLAASLSGSGVTVNGVTFTDPTHITVNLTIAPNAAIGARTITVTNPDGQTASGNIITLASCVTAANCHGNCSCVGGNCGNWVAPLASGAVSAAYTNNNQTFIASDSQLAGFDETNGVPLAGFPKMAGGPIENFPVVAPLADGQTYALFTAQDGFLYKVNVAGGAASTVDLRRAGCAMDVIQGTPAVQIAAFSNDGRTRDLLMVATHHGCGDTTGNEIFALDAANITGARVWTMPAQAGGMSFASEGGALDYAHNLAIFATHSDAGGQKTVWAVNTGDGTLAWSAVTASVINRPQPGYGALGHVFVADTSGTLSAFNLVGGALAWSRSIPGATFTNNIWAEFRGTFTNTVFLTDSGAGTAYAVNDGGNTSSMRWGPISFGSARSMTAPSFWAGGGRVYVGLDNGAAAELDATAQTTKTHVMTKSATPAAGNVCGEPTFAIAGTGDVDRIITGVNGPAGSFVRQACVPF